MGTIVWVDSDAGVKFDTLSSAGYTVRVFLEVCDALVFIAPAIPAGAISCVITSSMKRGGREEKGLPSGMQMIDTVIKWSADLSYKPLFAFITQTADEQEVLERGVSIFVRGDRNKLQREVIRLLETSSCRDFRRNRIPGSICGFSQRDFARQVANFLCVGQFSRYHNSYADLCFCERCEPVRIMIRAGAKYALPSGWFGFGIILRDDFQDRRGEIEAWHVAYHGTSEKNVSSILREKRLMFPGDVLQDGTTLPIAHGNCGAHLFTNGSGSPPPVIYISPTVNYASNPFYAKPFSYKGKLVQAVFQCRVKPNSYMKYGKTTAPSRSNHPDEKVRALSGPPHSFDLDFHDSELEWIVADRESVVPYRLLLRWFE